MKVSKAIEVLTTFDKGQYPGGAENFRAAIKLGIEALKRFQEGRPKSFISTVLLLPGETPEEGIKNDD